MRKRLTAVLCALAMTLGLIAATAPAAQAGTGLVFTVVDADNDPYAGLYLRDATNMASANRISQRYMLYGTQVELICFAEGESVGPHNNRLWHKVHVRNNHAAGQTGWVADRYLNTPIKANGRVNGEPDCNGGGNPPVVVQPAPNLRGAVYYSPFPRGEYMPEGSALSIPYTDWSYGQNAWYQARYYMNRVGIGSVPTPNCNMSKVANTPTFNPNSARSVTTVAGWSAGRVPAIARVKTHGSSINHMVLIDPGSFRELTVTGCDKQIKAGDTLFTWLKNNPTAKLTIFAGTVTRDSDSATNGYAHRGIQEAYFGKIRQDAGVASRVVVCNYGYDHTTMFSRFDNYIDKAPVSRTSCPEGATGWNP